MAVSKRKRKIEQKNKEAASKILYITLGVVAVCLILLYFIFQAAN